MIEAEVSAERVGTAVAADRTIYHQLCDHCNKQPTCKLIQGMTDYAQGLGPWPEGGWVTDVGAGYTCLSYESKSMPRMPRQTLRALQRTPEEKLPHVCGGCAAKKGTDASVALHTQRDYRQAVRDQSGFTCHEDPTNTRLCGGWCRAVKRKIQPSAPQGHHPDLDLTCGNEHDH